jgi:thiamine biosynthesis lipoprotein ApbE
MGKEMQMKHTYCKGCGREIVFIVNPKTGKPHPYEIDQVTSHFASCAKASELRKAARKDTQQQSLFDHSGIHY